MRGVVVKLDRGFPLVRVGSGAEFRCKHATALVKGEKHRAVIGDEVLLDIPEDADMAQIQQIVERRNTLVRKDPTERALPQVLAANFDTVIIAHPLSELNLRRLDRELVLAQGTGAHVVVALTKADLAADAHEAETARAMAESVAADDVDVLVVSEADAASIESLRAQVPAGTVAVLIGRSGVGKSSLVNLLAGRDVQETTPVREADGKGRHTTVNRTMVPVAGGGSIVDMPGVRSVGLWESAEGIAAAFSDITKLAQECRFRDCKHINEPGCAVLAAVRAGVLNQARLDSYTNLMRENEEQQRKREEAHRLRERTGHPRRRG
jgi:ribosome biogenesis GTPase